MTGYGYGYPAGGGRRPRLLRWLPFVVTLLEVLVFVAVGRWIGFGWAILLTLGLGAAGLVALRLVGLSTWRKLRAQAVSRGSGADEARTALTGVGVRILGAFLLMLPGFVSSAAGALLLIPPVGRLVGRLLPGAVIAGSLWRAGRAPGGPGTRGSGTRGSGAATGPGAAAGPDVVEGEVVEVDVDDVDPPDRSASDYHDAIPVDEGRDE